jgi:hypothetical protein
MHDFAGTLSDDKTGPVMIARQVDFIVHGLPRRPVERPSGNG